MRFRFLCIALAALGASSYSFGQTAYAVDGSDNLWSVNLATGASTLIGNDGAFLEGLALSPGGVLYGTDTGGNVYTINTTTAASTLLGNNGFGNEGGLDFAGSNLWASNFSSPTTLNELNTTTGLGTGFSVTSAITDGVARAMAFDPTDTFAFTLNDVAAGGQALWETTSAGVSTELGALTGVAGQTVAMKFDNNTGILWALGEGGQIYQINPLTGAATLTGSTGSQVWLDMAIAPAPEPVTMVALGAGVLALAARKRRK